MIRYATPVDFMQNEVKQLVIENLESHPFNVSPGYVYFNIVDFAFYGFDGNEWTPLDNNHIFPVSQSIFAVIDSKNSRIEFDLGSVVSDQVVKIKLPASDVILRKNNFSGTRKPLATDDITQGYDIGSRWVDVVNKEEYVSLAAGQGVAVWQETTLNPVEVSFTKLNDTPSEFYTHSGKVLSVNDNEDGIEFKSLKDAITNVLPDLGNIKVYKHIFNNATSELINHDLGTNFLIYKAFDSNGNEIFFDSFTCVDINHAKITMNPASSGYLTIMGIL